jgi:hypothetical protein
MWPLSYTDLLRTLFYYRAAVPSLTLCYLLQRTGLAYYADETCTAKKGGLEFETDQDGPLKVHSRAINRLRPCYACAHSVR